MQPGKNFPWPVASGNRSVKLKPAQLADSRRQVRGGVMQPSDDPVREPSDQAVIVDAEELPALFDALRGRGYTVVGPTVRDGAIVVAELASAAELPFGWGWRPKRGATGCGNGPTPPRSGTPPARSHGRACCIRRERGYGPQIG